MTGAMWTALLITLTEGMKLYEAGKKGGLLPTGDGGFKAAEAVFRAHQVKLASDFDAEMQAEQERRQTAGQPR